MENTLPYQQLQAKQPGSLPQTIWQTLKLLWLLATKQNKLLILSLTSSVILQLSKLACLSLTAWLIAQALAQQTLEPISWLVLLGTSLSYAVCRWWQADVSHQLAFALIEDLQVGAFQALRRAMPIPGKSLTELSQIATQDAHLMEHFYAHLLGDWLSALCLPLGCLPLLCYYSVWWGAAWLALALLCLLSPWFIQQRASEHAQAANQAEQNLNACLSDGLRGRRDLLVFGQSKKWLEQIQKLQQQWYQAQRACGRQAKRQQQLRSVCESASLVLGLIAMYLACQQNPANWGSGFCLLVLSSLALRGLLEASAQTDKLGEIIAAARRLADLLQAPARPQLAVAEHPNPSTTAALELQQLSFKQPTQTILKQLSFTLKQGEIVALTGASGCGKSTCARLVLGLEPLQEGHILLAAQPIQNYPQASLCSEVSAVLQDSFIFNQSLAYNISLGRPEASMAEIYAAAKLAHIHDFILQLPEGYASRIGSDQFHLSGGQRQRIALARAFLMRPRVLILDEASAQLDAQLQQQLLRSLRSIAQDCAILFITHQASCLAAADRVLWLANAELQAQGRHQDLLHSHADYAALVNCRS